MNSPRPDIVILFDCDGVMCPPLRFADVLRAEHGIAMEMTREFFRDAFIPAAEGEDDAARAPDSAVSRPAFSRA